MEAKQAKKLVNFLSKEGTIKHSLNLNTIINRLDRGIYRTYSNFNTFEFSFISPENTIRLLHINFYKPTRPPEVSQALRYRMNSIIDIFEYANRKLGFEYNLEILKDTFLLVKDILCPVQFGCETGGYAAPIMKEYFSVINNHKDSRYLIKEIAILLGLNFQMLEKEFIMARPIDTVGIDFLPDGRCNLKIYPYYQQPFKLADIRKVYQRYRLSKDQFLEPFLTWIGGISLRHIGFLYRISKNSEIDSAKIWVRLEKSIPFGLLPPFKGRKSARLENWLYDSKNIITSFKSLVSYLTLENSNLGIYFR